MTRFSNSLIFLLLFGCATTAQNDGGAEADRQPIAKADIIGSCEDACGGMSSGNCWCDDACADFGDCCADKEAVCDEGANPCVLGFEPVPDVSSCLADASCYELDDGSWCTGGCPLGSQLDLDGEPECLPADPCPPGHQNVPTVSDCAQDTGCFELDDGSWCSGQCPIGTELGTDDSGTMTCVPAEPGTCIEGFDPVATESNCLADAACYQMQDGSWCTGECPKGTELDTATGPQCIPAG
jgi:hypothetical protein